MRALVIAAVAATLIVAGLPAAATPVCPDEPRAACGGRIFPEVETTASFVQHDSGEYESGIKALEREFPRFVKVRTFTQVLGHEAKSFEDRDIWLVEITDFNVPEDGKIPVVVSLSVHGFERAGLEGGVRYMEDLARWAANDPDHKLRNGTSKDSIAVPVSEVLSKVHLYLANINPDGWAAGDAQNGGVYQRGNGQGVDLNREFPTMGWSYPPYTALSEPESKAWNELMHQIDPVVTADLHGELTSAQNAFADMMYPAGQWDPLEQAREERLARHMASNVRRYFRKDDVHADEASGQSGMVPAEYATGYDVVGYDAAGFMGDWFTQEFGAVDMDVEHFLSHVVPNSTWVHALEDAHIASVRGEVEAMVVEALVTRKVRTRLNWRKTGYVNDRRWVTSADGYGGPKPPKGVRPKAYRVSRMQYFRHASRYTPSPLRPVGPRRIAHGGLKGIRRLVIADRPFGGKFKDQPRQRRRAVKALERFVRRGGNLILTDKAVILLAEMDLVPRKSIKRRVYTAGHINIDKFKDPYLKGVHHTASQTYYEVPLGYSIDQDTSPHWIVKAKKWRKAGGKKIAHVEENNEVGLGRLKLGRGTIGIIAALLPKPTEHYDHFYGLTGYAVAVAGGQILDNMVTYRRR